MNQSIPAHSSLYNAIQVFSIRPMQLPEVFKIKYGWDKNMFFSIKIIHTAAADILTEFTVFTEVAVCFTVIFLTCSDEIYGINSFYIFIRPLYSFFCLRGV